MEAFSMYFHAVNCMANKSAKCDSGLWSKFYIKLILISRNKFSENLPSATPYQEQMLVSPHVGMARTVNKMVAPMDVLATIRQ